MVKLFVVISVWFLESLSLILSPKMVHAAINEEKAQFLDIHLLLYSRVYHICGKGFQT